MLQPLKSHPDGFDGALTYPFGAVCAKGVPVTLQYETSMMQKPFTLTPLSVCPDIGPLHVDACVGGSGPYVQPPLLQVPVDWWHTSGGMLQSLLVQQLAVGMQLPLHDLSPEGQLQPPVEQTSPPLHAIAPLHVQVPALQVFVIRPEQSAFVQQLAAGMQALPHILKPD